MSLFLNLLFEQIAIPTHIYLQNLASIQPRTSPFKFARCPHTDRPGDTSPLEVNLETFDVEFRWDPPGEPRVSKLEARLGNDGVLRASWEIDTNGGALKQVSVMLSSDKPPTMFVATPS